MKWMAIKEVAVIPVYDGMAEFRKQVRKWVSKQKYWCGKKWEQGGRGREGGKEGGSEAGSP